MLKYNQPFGRSIFTREEPLNLMKLTEGDMGICGVAVLMVFSMR